jgi:hypothetical protein
VGKKVVQVILDLVNATFNRKMRESSQVTSKFSKTASSNIAGLVATWGKVAAAVGVAYGAYRLLIKPAMDAQEAASKFNTIFGRNSEQVREWADRLGQDIGRSSRSLQSMATDVMALVSPMAATREAAIRMSEGAVQAAQDLASFHNAEVPEALAAIRSGLTGEAEPLKRFGILLSDAAMQEYALAQGIRTKVSDMSSAEKLQLRYNMILAGMGEAQGDAQRTSGSLTNQMRALHDVMSDNATEIGERMVPGLTDLVSSLRMSMQEGGAFKTIIDALAVAINRAAEVLADLIRLTSEQGREENHMRDRVANLTDKLDDLVERYGSFGDAVATATRGFRPAQEQVEKYRFQLQVLSDALGAQHPLLAQHQDAMRHFGILSQQTTQATEQHTQAVRRNTSAGNEWYRTWQRNRENLQGFFADLASYVGEETDSELALEEQRFQNIRKKIQEIAAYTGRARLLSTAEAHAAIEAAEQAHQDNIQNIRDMAAVRDAERAEKERADREKMLRARIGMESQSYSAMRMFADMGQQLMQSKNKGLFRLGQAMAISNSIMNAAEAVMKGMSYGPFIGIPYAALVATTLGVQLARIKAQKPPEMAVGTWQVPRDMTATIHRGEQIIPRPMAESVRAGEAALVGAGGGGDRTIVLQIDGRTIGEITDGYRAQNARNMGTRDYMTRSVYR